MRIGALSCHTFEAHTILIQKENFQPEIPFRSGNIAVQNLLEKRLYQENRSSAGYVVPPPRVSRSPDTKLEFSARNSFSFKRCFSWNVFRKARCIFRRYAMLCHLFDTLVLLCHGTSFFLLMVSPIIQGRISPGHCDISPQIFFGCVKGYSNSLLII